jgi:hypothetical protein
VNLEFVKEFCHRGILYWTSVSSLMKGECNTSNPKKDLCTNIEKTMFHEITIAKIHNLQCSTMLIDQIYTLNKY